MAGMIQEADQAGHQRLSGSGATAGAWHAVPQRDLRQQPDELMILVTPYVPSTGSCARPGKPLMACLVCSWIMPAIAIEPPEGISSVVSARRVLIEGMVQGVDLGEGNRLRER